MILVDTSVWVDHLCRGDTALAIALNANTVAVHSLVIGELACGQLKARQQVLSLLASLPRLPPATDEEALYFLENYRLYGRGLGYIDVHLLAAASLHADARLWTRDRRLKAVAVELDVNHRGSSH